VARSAVIWRAARRGPRCWQCRRTSVDSDADPRAPPNRSATRRWIRIAAIAAASTAKELLEAGRRRRSWFPSCRSSPTAGS